MRNREYGYGAVIALVMAAVTIFFCFVFYTTQLKTGEVRFTVDSKERVNDGDSSKYLIFSTDDETYQVTDNILFGKMESSDRYAALDEGKTYECTTIGIRLPILSWYKNLKDCEEVK